MRQTACVARDLPARETVAAAQERLAVSATRLMQGCSAAGILVLRDGRVQTPAPVGQLVIDSGPLRERLGRGACFDAARTHEGDRVCRIGTLTAERQRRPRCAPRPHAQMRDVVAPRHVIGKAVGILMGMRRVTEE